MCTIYRIQVASSSEVLDDVSGTEAGVFNFSSVSPANHHSAIAPYPSITAP
jgi:hypothetical protein